MEVPNEQLNFTNAQDGHLKWKNELEKKAFETAIRKSLSCEY